MNEEQYERAIVEIEKLLGAEEDSIEMMVLETLVDLVEVYEAQIWLK